MLMHNVVVNADGSWSFERCEPSFPLVSNGYHKEIERFGDSWRYVGTREQFTGAAKVIVQAPHMWSVE